MCVYKYQWQKEAVITLGCVFIWRAGLLGVVASALQQKRAQPRRNEVSEASPRCSLSQRSKIFV